jgi:3-phenylpropionate/cinnamic acid dioxygenase small subunit
MTAADDAYAIETLIYTYAERVDRGDFEGVAELFEGALYRCVVGDEVVVYEGSEGVRGTFEGLVMRYEDGTPRTRHVTTNVMVEIDGDEAAARSYFTVFQQVGSTPLQPIIAGRYHDRLARVDGRWRFTDRLIFSDLIGDLSRHLAADVFTGEG